MAIDLTQGVGSFIENAPLGIAMFDRDMNYVAFSTRWFDELGVAERDVLGMNVHAAHPELPERWKELHERALSGGHVNEDDDFWAPADGGRRWFRHVAYPWTDHNGLTGGIIVFVENITAKKEAEAVRRELEQRYRIFFDNAAFGAAELDLEGRIIKVNKCLCDIGGYSVEEMIGRKASDFTHPDDHARYLGARAAYYDGQSDALLRSIRFYRKDGSVAWIRITPTLVRNKEGSPHYSCGIVEDVTESVKAEAALRESEERLRHLSDNIPNSAVYKFSRDKDGRPRIAYISAEVEALTGISAGEATSNPALLLGAVLPEYRSKYIEARLNSVNRVFRLFH